MKIAIKSDFVRTGYADFLMVHVPGVNSRSSMADFFPRGNHSFLISDLDPSFVDHVEYLGYNFPDFRIKANIDPNTRLAIPGINFGDIIQDKNMYRLADTYAKRQKLYEEELGTCKSWGGDVLNTAEKAFDYVKEHVFYNIWNKFLVSQCDNFFPYNKDVLAAVSIKNEDIKFADSVGMDNNGHGDFEIKHYRVSSRKNLDGKFYDTESLTLKHKKTFKGQGIYAFDNLF